MLNYYVFLQGFDLGVFGVVGVVGFDSDAAVVVEYELVVLLLLFPIARYVFDLGECDEHQNFDYEEDIYQFEEIVFVWEEENDLADFSHNQYLIHQIIKPVSKY